MSTTLGNNDTFKGNTNNAIRQVTVPAGGACTIQKLSTSPAGVETWIDVPDGALTGPTNVTMYAPNTAVYRVTSVTGYAELD